MMCIAVKFRLSVNAFWVKPIVFVLFLWLHPTPAPIVKLEYLKNKNDKTILNFLNSNHLKL